MATNAAALLVVIALRVLYGMRNKRANREGTPARSRMEAKLEVKQVEGDVHDDVAFRYAY